MENLHIPVPGEFMLTGHKTSSDCPCEPVRHVVQKRASSGSRGSHQGYNTVRIEWRHRAFPDEHGNRIAREGYDRCECGCKYWENDKCIDCGADISQAQKNED